MPAQDSSLSPMKTRRLDEKTSLQTLNGRLEAYVQKVKDVQDAKLLAEKELEIIRARMQKEIDNVTNRLNKELEQTRKDLEYEIDQRTRLQVLEQDQFAELTKLRNETTELHEVRALNDQMRRDLEQERSSNKLSKETLAKQTTAFQAMKRKHATLEKEHRKITSTYQTAMSELEALRKETQDYRSGRDSSIQSVREEMNQAHQAERAQWKKELEARVAESEKEIRLHFETMFQNKESELEEVKEEMTGVKEELAKTTTEYEESLQMRQALTEKVAILERDYREGRKVWQEQKKAMEAQIRSAKNAKAAKENEFNELMDVKIALDAEISAYRRILDQEEDRVNDVVPAPTPSRKRKKSSSAVSASARKLQKTKDTSSGLTKSAKISSLDLEKGHVIISNLGKTSISLDGWKLHSCIQDKDYFFEAVELKPSESIDITFGKKAPKSTSKKTTPTTSFASPDVLFDKVGDILTLVNAKQHVIDRVIEGSVDQVYKEPLEAKTIHVNPAQYNPAAINDTPDADVSACDAVVAAVSDVGL